MVERPGIEPGTFALRTRPVPCGTWGYARTPGSVRLKTAAFGGRRGTDGAHEVLAADGWDRRSWSLWRGHRGVLTPGRRPHRGGVLGLALGQGGGVVEAGESSLIKSSYKLCQMAGAFGGWAASPVRGGIATHGAATGTGLESLLQPAREISHSGTSSIEISLGCTFCLLVLCEEMADARLGVGLLHVELLLPLRAVVLVVRGGERVSVRAPLQVGAGEGRGEERKPEDDAGDHFRRPRGIFATTSSWSTVVRS